MCKLKKRKEFIVFGFFKRIFSRKYVKHIFLKSWISSSELKDTLDLCTMEGFEVVSYTIRRVYGGYNVTVYTKKKEK